MVNMRVYLTSGHYVEQEMTPEQVEQFVKEFQSPSCTVLNINGRDTFWHIVKQHIVSVGFEKWAKNDLN